MFGKKKRIDSQMTIAKRDFFSGFDSAEQLSDEETNFTGYPYNKETLFEKMARELGIEGYEFEECCGGHYDEVDFKNEVVHISDYRTEESFRAALRHELEHILTRRKFDLRVLDEVKNDLDKAVFDSFMAFHSINEYLSWRAACKEWIGEKSTYSLATVCEKDIYSSSNLCNDINDLFDAERTFFDICAAHAAYCEIHCSDDDLRHLNQFNREKIEKIFSIIYREASLIPKDIIELRRVGAELREIYAQIRLRR